jgi:putative FmdB family regulatory protein
MPTYGFICNECNHSFDVFLKISERENPTKENCPSCKKDNCITRSFDGFTQTVGSDSTMNANKATGGQWNELMGKMKKGLSKRYHDRLDKASSQTARIWRG